MYFYIIFIALKASTGNEYLDGLLSNYSKTKKIILSKAPVTENSKTVRAFSRSEYSTYVDLIAAQSNHVKPEEIEISEKLNAKEFQHFLIQVVPNNVESIKKITISSIFY